MFSRFWKSNGDAGAIDDSVVVPSQGCLDENIKLPTYRLKGKPTSKPKHEPITDFSYPVCDELTIDDVSSTISQQIRLARRVLFETARLKRSFYSLGPLKLSPNARLVDIELIKLVDVVVRGYDLIEEPDGGEQSLLVKGPTFHKAQSTAKKALLDLEKAFNDNVLGELKDGMRRRGRVDHKKLVAAIEDVANGISAVYIKLITVRNQEIEVMEVTQAREGHLDENFHVV